MRRQPQPGEVWRVDFGSPVGHEQACQRPALVLSDQRLNSFDLSIVSPITRTYHQWPVHVEISPEGTGLSETSYIQAEQVRTISHGRLLARLGAVDTLTLVHVQRLIATLLDLPMPPPRR